MRPHDRLDAEIRGIRLALVATGAAALAAGVATFFGLRGLLAPGSAEFRVMPVVGAAVIAFILFAVWHKLLHVVPVLMKPGTRSLGLALAVVTAFVTIAISSWFAATAIGGTAALEHHMYHSLSSFRESVENAYANSLGQQSLSDEVKRRGDLIAGMADAEQRTGQYSGLVGKGEVEASLRLAAGTLAGFSNRLQTRQANVEEDHEDALATLARMQTILVNQEQDVRDRQRDFANASTALQGQLTAMGDRSALESVLGTSFNPAIETQGASPSQKQAVADLRTQMDEFASDLERRVTRLKDGALPVAPVRYTPMNEATATMRYASAIAGAWAVGIGIDLIPLLFVLILTVGVAERSRTHAVRRIAGADLPFPSDDYLTQTTDGHRDR